MSFSSTFDTAPPTSSSSDGLNMSHVPIPSTNVVQPIITHPDQPLHHHHHHHHHRHHSPAIVHSSPNSKKPKTERTKPIVDARTAELLTSIGKHFPYFTEKKANGVLALLLYNVPPDFNDWKVPKFMSNTKLYFDYIQDSELISNLKNNQGYADSDIIYRDAKQKSSTPTSKKRGLIGKKRKFDDRDRDDLD